MAKCGDIVEIIGTNLEGKITKISKLDYLKNAVKLELDSNKHCAFLISESQIKIIEEHKTKLGNLLWD